MVQQFFQPEISYPSIGETKTGEEYPKPADLLGCLLLLRPVAVKQRKDPFSRDKDRCLPVLIAHTLVVDGPIAGHFVAHDLDVPETGQRLAGDEFIGMDWHPTLIVNAGQLALEQDRPAILGRLWRYLFNESVGRYGCHWDVETMIKEWLPGQPAVRHSWSLADYTRQDANKATDAIGRKG